MNALGTNVYQNALKTYNSSNDTTTNATNAANSASSANNSALTASTAANNANNSYSEMQKLYLGSKTSPPTVDNQGQPLQKGTWYTNTTTGQWFWWNGSAWILGVGDLTTVDWSTQVTNKPTTLAGYGITDNTWANLKSKPTTVAAAGLTDAVTTAGAQMISGQKSFTNGISFGVSLGASKTDLSKHISLYGGTYGFSVNGSRINYVVPIFARHYFVINGEDMGYVGEAGFVSTGDVTAYSDERLKKDWTPIAPGFVEQLAGVKHGTYTRTDTGQRQAGVSAQALQKILSEAVQVVDDDKQLLGVAYGNAALVACVQLAQRVLQQEERIKALEAKQ